jgi:hypothetical protein
VPRVAQVNGIAINVYFRDHNPPHFHAIEADDEALIAIRDFSLLAGGIPSLADVCSWASTNQTLLIDAWNRCNPDKPY